MLQRGVFTRVRHTALLGLVYVSLSRHLLDLYNVADLWNRVAVHAKPSIGFGKASQMVRTLPFRRTGTKNAIRAGLAFDPNEVVRRFFET